jgi:hypothetical protein
MIAEVAVPEDLVVDVGEYSSANGSPLSNLDDDKVGQVDVPLPLSANGEATSTGTVHEDQQEERAEQQADSNLVRDLIEGYVDKKLGSSDPDDPEGLKAKKNKVINRAQMFGIGVSVTGDTVISAKEMGADLVGQFNQLDVDLSPAEVAVEVAAAGSQADVGIQAEAQPIDLERISQEFIVKLTHQVKEKLQGQESKLKNAENYIAFMTQNALAVVKESSAELTTAEYRQKIEDSLRMVAMATEAINFQDKAANAVTLGDHGWHHLYQDMRDALKIAEGFNGDKLTAKQQLLIGLTAAYHDIGYASPQINDAQKDSSANYYLDTGHPLLSFVFVRQNADHFRSILSEEEFDALSAMVINHEDPEAAKAAGPDYEILSRAFAYADAGASVGQEKVPPIVAQVPEVMKFLYLLNQVDVKLKSNEIDQSQADTLIENARNEVQASIEQKGFDPDQAAAILNVFTDHHLSGRTFNLLVGRLAGEMADPKVEEAMDGSKRVVFRMNMGEANELEAYLPEAVKAGAVIAVKVFVEQAGLRVDDQQAKQMHDFLLQTDEAGDLEIADLGITLDREVVVDDEGKVVGVVVKLQTGKVSVIYDSSSRAETQRDFYDKIFTAVAAGNEALVGAINDKILERAELTKFKKSEERQDE